MSTEWSLHSDIDYIIIISIVSVETSMVILNAVFLLSGVIWLQIKWSRHSDAAFSLYENYIVSFNSDLRTEWPIHSDLQTTVFVETALSLF